MATPYAAVWPSQRACHSYGCNWRSIVAHFQSKTHVGQRCNMADLEAAVFDMLMNLLDCKSALPGRAISCDRVQGFKLASAGRTAMKQDERCPVLPLGFLPRENPFQRVASSISKMHCDAVGSVIRQADAAHRKVELALDNCRRNFERRQLRLRYGGNPNRMRVHNGHFAAVIPGDSAVEAVLTLGINNFLNLYNVALITRLILTWFPNPPEAIVGPLSSITDPYLNLFRGIIPPLGGTIDLSPILAFIVLDLFSNAFAALPAEMPKDGSNHSFRAAHNRKFQAFNFSQTRLAFMRRLEAAKQKREGKRSQ